MQEIANFNPSNKLELNSHVYTFKDYLANYNYSYMCQHRKTCKVIMKITREELEKYKNNINKEIKFTITSKEHEHTCQGND